jgi:TetR/AcrR family transcriptional regulator, transcriptional repressor for nem operon
MFMAGNRKQETRQRIVKAADRSFRSHGYAGVGVDGIAKEAGVTSGAFYAHLGSKDQAFVAALDISLSEALADLPKFRRDYGSNWVKAFAEYYLGQAHRADLACGCAMTSLSPEVVRFDDRVRALYEKKMSAIVDIFASGLIGGSPESRRSRAWATLSTLIGGLILARGMKSRKAAEMIAAGVKAAAIATAGECAS